MFQEIEQIAALGATISLAYRPESYYGAKEKWTLSAELVQDGAGIRVETSAATMGACIQQAISKFHTLRQKGFVAYALALPKPDAPADSEDETQEEIV